MANIRHLLESAKPLLAQMTDQPLLEAEMLLAFVLKKPRSFLHAWHEHKPSDNEIEQFTHYVKRRCNKEPIAYLTGSKEFWSLEFLVSPDTLIPRPETELLVESVLALYNKENRVRKIADLGTGSGAIGLALAHERPLWQIYATDLHRDALHIAESNAHRLAVENIFFFQGNWCAALPCFDFDVIVSNPPYLAEAEWTIYGEGLKYEPKLAFVAGQDGLEAIRQISESAKYYLKPNGYLLVEHGFWQGEKVRQLFASAHYSHIHSLRDLAGHERVTLGQAGLNEC